MASQCLEQNPVTWAWHSHSQIPLQPSFPQNFLHKVSGQLGDSHLLSKGWTTGDAVFSSNSLLPPGFVGMKWPYSPTPLPSNRTLQCHLSHEPLFTNLTSLCFLSLFLKILQCLLLYLAVLSVHPLELWSIFFWVCTCMCAHTLCVCVCVVFGAWTYASHKLGRQKRHSLAWCEHFIHFGYHLGLRFSNGRDLGSGKGDLF